MADKKVPNLKAKYQAEVAPALMQKFGYKSVMQIPKIDKIVVNCGCGEARDNSKVLEAVVGDLTKITGQKAIITKAKKSVANFKLREGMPIGAKVTLRGDRMWEFLDRLFNVALPLSLIHIWWTPSWASSPSAARFPAPRAASCICATP